MKIRGNALQAVSWAGASALLRAALQFAQMVLLARWLLPEQFGLVALIAIFHGILQLIAEGGLSSWLMQTKSVTKTLQSTLFWLGLALALITTIIILVFASPVSRVLGRPELEGMLNLLAMNYPLIALAAPIKLMREKRLAFAHIAAAEVAAAATGVATTVVLVYAGFGAIACVWGALMSSLVGAITAWQYFRDGWSPVFSINISEARGCLNFGSVVLVNNLINQIAASIDMYIGARIMQIVEFGLYSLPRNLMLQLQSVINPMIGRVGLPLIAGAAEDKSHVRAIYLTYLRYISAGTAPMYVGLGLFGPGLLPNVLGEAWKYAGSAMVPLAAWGYLRSTFNPLGGLMLGTGRAWLSLKWNLFQLAVAMPVLAIGARGDGADFGMALLLVIAALLVPAWCWIVRPITGLSAMEYFGPIARPFFLAVVAGLPWWWLSMLFNNSVVVAIQCAMAAFLTYIGLSCVFQRALVNELLANTGLRQ
jgi:lipopolysaccharide exporter